MLKERGSECGAGKTAILPEFKHSTKYVFSTFCGICTNRPPLEQNNGPPGKRGNSSSRSKASKSNWTNPELLRFRVCRWLDGKAVVQIESSKIHCFVTQPRPAFQENGKGSIFTNILISWIEQFIRHLCNVPVCGQTDCHYVASIPPHP